MKKQTLIYAIFFLAFANGALAQKMTVKDSDLNVLMEVNDEGAIGSITLPSGAAPGTTTNKLYNVSGSLYWNGSELGMATSSGGWTDDGTIVRLITGTDKVGIGVTTPAYPLDVDTTIGINNTQVIYLPEQTSFTGTLYLGDGGGSLSHSFDSTGWYNTAVGIEALNANETAHSNTASGYRALYSNTGGDCNTASGYRALYSNTMGPHNTASGYKALYSNIEGNRNTANGAYALYNTTGDNNTAVGYNALYTNDVGEFNTAIGSYALYINESSENTACGFRSLYYNTSGIYNTGTGCYALLSNTTGIKNTGIGSYANYYNETGSNNTIVGHEAGRGSGNHSKSGNVLIGYQAGYSAEEAANKNIFIGYQAGYSETDSCKLYIENSSSSSPLIGGDFDADELYFNGDVGIGMTSPNEKLTIEGIISLDEQSGDPSTTSGYGKFYAKDDGKAYFRNDGGTTYDLTAGSGHWELGTNGIFEDDAGVIVGIDQTVTLANGGFSLAAGDLFVQDQLGVEGNVYTDGAFVAGSSLSIIDGSIIQSTGSELKVILGGNSGDDFIVDTDVLVVESDNNYVGIGTTSPLWKLEVAWEPPGDNINPIALFKTTGASTSAGAIRVQNTQGNQYSFGITPHPGNEFAIAYNSNISLSGDIFRLTSTGDITASSLDLGTGSDDDLSATDVTDLTDGGETTLHKHRNVVTISLPDLTANTTKRYGILAPPSDITITRIEIGFYAVPSSAAGTVVADVYNYDGTTDNRLNETASFDLESLYSKYSSEIPEQSTAPANLDVDADEYIYLEVTSDNADMTGGMGGSITLEYVVR